MNLPEYITKEEVQRVCKELGLSDWTQMEDGGVDRKEAAVIRDVIGAEALEISLDVFTRGLEIELEHGMEFPEANVTNNHPILTGKIVLAHLKEMLDYYERLEVAELEGDMFKAHIAGNEAKVAAKHALWIQARAELSEAEANQRRS